MLDDKGKLDKSKAELGFTPEQLKQLKDIITPVKSDERKTKNVRLWGRTTTNTKQKEESTPTDDDLYEKFEIIRDFQDKADELKYQWEGMLDQAYDVGDKEAELFALEARQKGYEKYQKKAKDLITFD